jgi:hypothetical protein
MVSASSFYDITAAHGSDEEMAADIFGVLLVGAESGVHSLSIEGLGLSAARRPGSGPPWAPVERRPCDRSGRDRVQP